MLTERDEQIRIHLVVDIAEDHLFDLLTVHSSARLPGRYQLFPSSKNQNGVAGYS